MRLLLCFCLVVEVFGIVPKVIVEDGVITGTIYKTVLGREIFGFFGVPYALPPILENRFEPPKPVTPWKGEWNATYQASRCLQYSHINYDVIGEEDCLYLDVYTPKLPDSSESKLLDVLIYIHGGCFMYGTGNVKRPDYLLENDDIVYVAINYRLGPLGFFSTGDDVVPGNNGLKDQSKALLWVKNNIAYFGGDSNKITIAGMSAGGASVQYHYLSPMSQGLFKRGISMSGTTTVSWALPRNISDKSKRLAGFLGCPTLNNKYMIECLKTRPARKIVENVKEFMPWRYFPYSPFGPVVEPKGKNRFLTERPIDIIRAGKVKNAPWLISVTRDEGLYPVTDFISQKNLMEQLNEYWNDIAPHLMDYNYTVPLETRDKVSEEIRNHFFGSNPITTKGITKVVGDRLFTAYIEFAIRELALSNKGSIYYYQFNYRGKHSISTVFTRNYDDYGVSHGDDTQYMVKLPYGSPHDNAADRKMIDVMTPMWLSYIRNGTPSIKNTEWPAVSINSFKDGISFLSIDAPDSISVKSTTDTSVFDFWNSTLSEFPGRVTFLNEEL